MPFAFKGTLSIVCRKSMLVSAIMAKQSVRLCARVTTVHS
jgi:hypothetical protein